jgi:hypothetical protein
MALLRLGGNCGRSPLLRGKFLRVVNFSLWHLLIDNLLNRITRVVWGSYTDPPLHVF